MTRDLEAALREARQALVNVGHCDQEGMMLFARIDAALSAASGEASGDAEPHYVRRARACGVFAQAERIATKFGPAPTEAPNVDRARKLTNEELREWIDEHERAPWIADKKKHPQNIYGGRLLALLKNLRDLRARIAEFEKERDLAKHHWRQAQAAYDSARAEGIAAERERCAKIAESRVPLWEEAQAIAAAIREAKP